MGSTKTKKAVIRKRAKHFELYVAGVLHYKDKAKSDGRQLRGYVSILSMVGGCHFGRDVRKLYIPILEENIWRGGRMGMVVVY